ncbi:MAG: NAD+ synthase, partial [Desulfovibrionaceae bacterium]|nr:NAD+ synthase [Desulfovibrionaceae bacterium]
VLLSQGEVRIVSRKVLLSNSDVFDESRYFEPGMASGLFDLNGWRIAVVMAEDTSNDPSLVNRAPTNDGDPVTECLNVGADALICLGAMPFAAHHIVRQENILASIAARYRIPTVFVNHSGAVDGNVFAGMSSVFDYTGNMTAIGAFFEEETVLVDIAVQNHPIKVPESDRLSLLWKALVTGVRHFVRDNGFERVVLGLSGGLDSALVAAVARDALGAGNVAGVFMPSVYTSEESRQDAFELAENLGIKLVVSPIDEIMAAYELALPDELEPQGVPRENIQARIRANILMAMANKHHALLLNTSNKSELAVGYGTIYGDMAGALSVLGDLYKTRVFDLADWYNSRQRNAQIPSRILRKEPSAELRENQKDTDSLPPYEILDQILENYIEKNIPEAQITVPGADAELVASVIEMIRAAEFKRAQAAPVIRLTVRGFGSGWRMPISRQVG